jgi:hypothetical protein
MIESGYSLHSLFISFLGNGSPVDFLNIGRVFLPADIVPPEGTKHPLNSLDPVFSETRNCHLSAALLKLKESGANLRQQHTSRQNMDLNAIKDFVASELKTVQVQYKSLNLREY